MRSLFARLHRRFGRRATGAELTRRVHIHRERFEATLPLQTLAPPPAGGGTARLAVLVVGGGFAGTMAAYTLATSGRFNVTLSEPNAIGGRVASSTTTVPGRTIERGAELIGLNHPTWIAYSQMFGLGLSVITHDDVAAAEGLALPVQLNGRSYSDTDALNLYKGMEAVVEPWSATAAAAVPFSAVQTPWNVTDAAKLDAQSLASQIPAGTRPDVADAINLSFYLDNTVDPARQSWLANLAQISAGSSGVGTTPLDFFSDTEVFRCESGNQSLALALYAAAQSTGLLRLDPNAVVALDNVGTRVIATSFDGLKSPYDYVVLAVPVAQLSSIPINGTPVKPIANGPAVKYFAPVGSRFWLPHAPLGFSDQIGMTWEGTDNQIGSGLVEISTFAGGEVAAKARTAADVNAFFQAGLQKLFGPAAYETPSFADWPGTPYIRTGYSCPAVNEVTKTQRSYATPVAGRTFLAGEYVSPPWFGFMEGALQSGLAAAQRVVQAAG